ncbi:MAG TPA: class I SAM-dependent methyltransferase [Armatimonadota bacterium]|nr:class I SAM-dependent methyltransferase [Armatimonadota bacterium]
MAEIPILDPVEAYRLWADNYPPYAHNPLMLAEERAMLSLMPSDLSAYSVLDAGCGAGRYMLQAARRGARRLLGVDRSLEMLERASGEWAPGLLALGSLEALPVGTGWADLVICALAIGHVPSLPRALAELSRVACPGGKIICSDLHPVGEKLGWQRTFRSDGQTYAVRHHFHTLDGWRIACTKLNLRIIRKLEPRLNPYDIPPGARFDRSALETPVALVLEIQTADAR